MKGEGRYGKDERNWARHKPFRDLIDDDEKLIGGPGKKSVDKLIAEYTEVRPCVVKGSPDACTVWLRVGVQQFCVTPEACDNRDEAQFMQCNLGRALWRLLYEERDGLEGGK